MVIIKNDVFVELAKSKVKIGKLVCHLDLYIKNCTLILRIDFGDKTERKEDKRKKHYTYESMENSRTLATSHPI